jgi:hypothetical protein
MKTRGGPSASNQRRHAGRGRRCTGAVEAVCVSDPERAFELISVRRQFRWEQREYETVLNFCIRTLYRYAPEQEVPIYGKCV